MKKITSYPSLSDVLMVEEQIQHMDYPKKTELWKALPKKMMYKTFCLIIDYLETSGKIMIDNEGRIIWTWNPNLLKKIQTGHYKEL
jgi:hypothetical protein